MKHRARIATSLAAVSAAAMFMTGPAFAITAEQIAAFDRDGDGTVDADKIEIYLLHNASPVLAEYDVDLDGALGPDEVATIESDARSAQATNVDNDEIRIKAAAGVPIPVPQPSESDTKPPADDSFDQRFYLRETPLDIAINKKAGDYDSVDGAKFSIFKDFNTGETAANINATLGYMIVDSRLEPVGGLQPGQLALTGYAFGPYLQAEGSVSSLTGLSEDSKLIAGAIGQLEFFSGPVFDNQLVSFSPYYQTDFNADAQIYGGQLIWEPVKLTAGLGARRSTSPAFDYLWQLWGIIDYKFVDDPGSTGLTEKNYLWAGVSASVKIWPFPSALKDRVFLQAKPEYFYDVLSGIDAWQIAAILGIGLDAEGRTAIELSYRTGTDHDTGEKSDRVTAEFSAKY